MPLNPIVRPILVIAGAAWAAASGALAAPLPSPEPERRGVEVCPDGSRGFFLVPGTDMCLRLGGEVYTRASAARGDDIAVTSGRDAAGRPTGEPRAVPVGEELRGITSRTDIIVQTRQRTDAGVLTTTARLRGTLPGATEVQEAWTHWAGVTAGLRSSFFTVGTGYNDSDGVSSDRTTRLLAYTHWAQPNLALTLSVEEGTVRRFQEGEWARYGGQTAPDIVAALYYEPEPIWVNAAVATHQVRDARGPGSKVGLAGVAALGSRFRYSDTSWGRGIVTGAVARGALDYLGMPANSPNFIRDEFGQIHLAEGYSGLASYEHFWTPEIRSAATASLYRSWADAGSFEWNTRGFWLTLGAEYIPVPGLSLGLDVTYYRDLVWERGEPPVRAEAVVGYGYARRSF